MKKRRFTSFGIFVILHIAISHLCLFICLQGGTLFYWGAPVILSPNLELLQAAEGRDMDSCPAARAPVRFHAILSLITPLKS